MKEIILKHIKDVVFWVAIYILMFLFLSGSQLYEFLLLITIVLFFRIGTSIREMRIPNDRKIELFLTLVIAFFAVVQVWSVFYEKIPRVYTPGVQCLKYIYLTQDGYGNYSVSFGNYGDLPAWLRIEFINTTNSLEVIEPSKYDGYVLVPVVYQNNKQNEFTFNFRVNNSSDKFGFVTKYIIHGDDLIDRGAAFYKIILNFYNSKNCEYL